MEGKNKHKSTIRSSSVEYLTFIASTGEGGINAIYEDENIWLTPKNDGRIIPSRNAHHQLSFKKDTKRQ